MFLQILTLTLCLTKALVLENFEVTPPTNYLDDPIYDLNGWVGQLQLQRCALVAIGLKYFAIFVEDEILGNHHLQMRNKFFVGICPQDVLEEWHFCSPSLAKKRKHKCRFKLKDDRFQPRVHRRFCDFKVLVNNKDCRCAPTIFGDPLMKVEGLPTCYIPSLPSSLCKYNVCGISQCIPMTVEDRIHTVNCSATCKEKSPFCEHPTDRTTRPPVPWSSWSKWRRVGESSDTAESSVATCINKSKKRGREGGGLDCLGPGTGCCSRSANCTCETFEEDGILKVQRTIYTDQQKARSRRSMNYYPSYVPPRTSYLFRFFRDAKKDDDNDLEDDDDEDDSDLDEDIVLEDNPNDEKPIPTTEELEKDEAVEEAKHNAVEEIKNETSPSAMKDSCENIIFRGIYLRMLVASVFVLNIL